MANAFKSYESNTITTITTVYTGPALTETTIIGLSIANVAATPATVSATLTKSTGTSYIVKNAPIPVGGSLIVVGAEQKLVVEATDTIKVVSDVTVDAITSVLEIS